MAPKEIYHHTIYLYLVSKSAYNNPSAASQVTKGRLGKWTMQTSM